MRNMNRHAARALAALLTIMVWGSNLPSATAGDIGQASAQAQAPALPAVDNFTLGFGRMMGQAEKGCALEGTLILQPGYLPVADDGAAVALRQMLSGATIRFRQQDAETGGSRMLAIESAGQPLLTMARTDQAGRAVWSLPEAADQRIETPPDLDLFEELLGIPWAKDAFAMSPEKAEGGPAWPETVLQMLRAFSDQEAEIAPASANALLDAWREEQTLAPLQALTADWRVVDKAALSYEQDDQGRWTRIRVKTQVAYGGGEPWTLDVRCTQNFARRAHGYTVKAAITRSKQNSLDITASLETTDARDNRLTRASRLTLSGSLNGHSVNLRVSGNETNDFVLEGQALTEQIKQNYTLNWRARDPALARLGLDEWRVTLGTKGILRSGDTAVTPASYAGTASLVMTRARRDFFSAEIPVQLIATAPDEPEPLNAELVWESIGEAEGTQLEEMRVRLMRHISEKLVKGLDAQMQEGLWLPPFQLPAQ